LIIKALPFPIIEVGKASKKEKKDIENDLEVFFNPEAVKIKETLKISQLINRFNIPIHKNPTMCPLGHTSENQSCFSFDDDTSRWHCFHCWKGGDIIHLYQRLYDYKNFSDTKNAMIKELFLDDKKYEEALKQISDFIRTRKVPLINNIDINNISKIMIKHYNFVTIEETDQIYYYDETVGVFKQKGEYIIQYECEKYFDGLSKTNIVNEITNKIKRLTHKPLSTFDQHQNLICLKNGVFNLETKLLINHSADYYFLNYLPINYNASSKCEKNLKFMKEIVEDALKRL